MSDHTVRRRGTDTSSRGIFASDRMWSWWQRVCDELGFTPTIVQGAWMTLAGGGAGASAGYHDGGGCFDLRTWDRTASQVEDIIRTCRRLGAGAWVRDHRHGMDPHIHLVLGSDHDLDDGAFWQWREYLAGRDGLSSQGRDYHWRPDPIVTKPPQEDDMPLSDEDLDKIAYRVWAKELGGGDNRKPARLHLLQAGNRAKAVLVAVGELDAAVEAGADKAEVRRRLKRIEAAVLELAPADDDG